MTTRSSNLHVIPVGSQPERMLQISRAPPLAVHTSMMPILQVSFALAIFVDDLQRDEHDILSGQDLDDYVKHEPIIRV